MDEPIPDELSQRQQDAIVALLNQPTVREAAADADVPERTLYRWLSNPAFSRAYRASRREAFRHAIALTQRYAPMAVNALAKVLMDTSVSASARVSAAVGILRFGREAIELDDLAGRIEALEQAQQEAPGSWPLQAG